jgi:hypothetical protein
MTKLSELAIEAHGGLQRWNQFEQVAADLQQGGVLWSLKGEPETLQQTTVTVGLRQEWASHSPFGAERRRSRFEPGRVALEAADGTVLDELRDPRSSFAGHTLQTPWTDLQLAFFPLRHVDLPQHPVRARLAGSRGRRAGAGAYE